MSNKYADGPNQKKAFVHAVSHLWNGKMASSDLENLHKLCKVVSARNAETPSKMTRA